MYYIPLSHITHNYIKLMMVLACRNMSLKIVCFLQYLISILLLLRSYRTITCILPPYLYSSCFSVNYFSQNNDLLLVINCALQVQMGILWCGMQRSFIRYAHWMSHTMRLVPLTFHMMADYLQLQERLVLKYLFVDIINVHNVVSLVFCI